MPIYAYRCASCGHSRDVLQKISDPQLTTCPACGIEQFQKQITAAGFQLKGSGWYVTDFRGGNSGNKSGDAASNAPDASASKTDSKPEATGSSDSAASTTTPAAAPTPAPAPASSSGT